MAQQDYDGYEDDDERDRDEDERERQQQDQSSENNGGNGSSGGGNGNNGSSYNSLSEIEALERKYNLGSSNRDSDVANLAGKNPEDRAAYIAALDKQYKGRKASDYGSAGKQVVQSWSGGGGGGGNSGGGDGTGNERINALLESLIAQQAERETERKARADGLFNTLNARASQALTVDGNNPMVRQQADAYAAAQERNSREYLADAAEGLGPNGNVVGEKRLISERAGQAKAHFEASLIGTELKAMRTEVAQSLTAMQGMLSADQEASLRQQMAAIDTALAQVGLDHQGRSLDLTSRGLDQQMQQMLMQNEQFMSGLDFNYWDRDNYYQRN